MIEDCAESLGSLYKEKHTGVFGKCGTLSFNGNKIITAGGGGAIITNDARLAEELKHLTTTARIPQGQHFVHDEVGYNYRMPNLNAALVCAQMENLDRFIEIKRGLANAYESFFQKSELDFVMEPESAVSNYWLNAVKTADIKMRDQLIDEFNDAGILARPLWRLMNKLDMYAGCQTDSLENSRWLEDRIVNIPSSAVTI